MKECSIVQYYHCIAWKTKQKRSYLNTDFSILKNFWTLCFIFTPNILSCMRVTATLKKSILNLTSFEPIPRSVCGSSFFQMKRGQVTIDEQMTYLAKKGVKCAEML